MPAFLDMVKAAERVEAAGKEERVDTQPALPSTLLVSLCVEGSARLWDLTGARLLPLAAFATSQPTSACDASNPSAADFHLRRPYHQHQHRRW